MKAPYCTQAHNKSISLYINYYIKPSNFKKWQIHKRNKKNSMSITIAFHFSFQNALMACIKKITVLPIVHFY